MRRTIRAAVAALALAGPLAGNAAAAPLDETPANALFGAVVAPAPADGFRVIGTYAKGCLAGGVALPVDGPAWQAMRLSRNRNWGHPALVDWLERFAAEARAEGWPGLLVGDLAQPRGGPMLGGHASHQIGLDADIWLTPMPESTLTIEAREEMSAVTMLADGAEPRRIDPALFGAAQLRLLRRAALSPEVGRIFVHPGIKQALCAAAGKDRAWLRRVRPWWGHDSHFHVRLRCPAGEPLCRDQEPPPMGDGCGADLAWWLTDEPWKPTPPPKVPPKPMLLADLPAQCRRVLEAR